MTSLVRLKLRQRFDGYRSFNGVAGIELVAAFIDLAEGTLSQSPEVQHEYTYASGYSTSQGGFKTLNFYLILRIRERNAGCYFMALNCFVAIYLLD